AGDMSTVAVTIGARFTRHVVDVIRRPPSEFLMRNSYATIDDVRLNTIPRIAAVEVRAVQRELTLIDPVQTPRGTTLEPGTFKRRRDFREWIRIRDLLARNLRIFFDVFYFRTLTHGSSFCRAHFHSESCNTVVDMLQTAAVSSH